MNFSSEPAEPARFQAGFAAVKITPPLGTPLAGYFHERIAERVRDDLYARVMTLTNKDGESVVVVSLDLICVEEGFVNQAKSLIHQATGVPPERTLISATHTHTGPEVRVFGAKVPVDWEYCAKLPVWIAEATGKAWNGRQTATVRHAKTDATGYVFNRIYRLPDGTEVMGRRPNAAGPAGPVDRELGVLGAFDEEGKLLGCVINVGIHTDVIGGAQADFISADWPGEISRSFSAVYGEDTVAMFLQGACGDTNQIPYQRGVLPSKGEQKALSLGRGLAGGAMLALEKAVPIDDDTLKGEMREIPIAWYTRTEALMNEVEDLKKQTDLKPPEKYKIKAIEEWPYDNQTVQFGVQALRIGSLSLFAVPAQIFVPISLEIKKWSCAAQTMVVELANARHSSYIPTTEQAERGAYGTRPIVSRWLEVDAGRKITDTAFLMLRKIQGAD